MSVKQWVLATVICILVGGGIYSAYFFVLDPGAEGWVKLSAGILTLISLIVGLLIGNRNARKQKKESRRMS